MSVVICCYTMDRWSDLCAAVDQVERQSGGRAQTVVCVDHNPRMEERARTELRTATVIANDQQQGLSGARNCGLQAATGALVVFLDDDAVPRPGWLAALTAPFADPRVLAVGGAAVPAWAPTRPGWFPEEFDWVVGCSYRGLPEVQGPIRNVMGCNMAFRASVFADGLRFRAGVGRTATGAEGCEETELCIRVRQQRPDALIWFEPAAVVDHRVTAQRATWRYFARRCFSEGRSKARVSGYVGSPAALSSEWTYTRQVLPRGVRRGIADGLAGRAAGLARSAAIVAGLGMTGAGYVRGRWAR